MSINLVFIVYVGYDIPGMYWDFTNTIVILMMKLNVSLALSIVTSNKFAYFACFAFFTNIADHIRKCVFFAIVELSSLGCWT